MSSNLREYRKLLDDEFNIVKRFHGDFASEIESWVRHSGVVQTVTEAYGYRTKEALLQFMFDCSMHYVSEVYNAMINVVDETVRYGLMGREFSYMYDRSDDDLFEKIDADVQWIKDHFLPGAFLEASCDNYFGGSFKKVTDDFRDARVANEAVANLQSAERLACLRAASSELADTFEGKPSYNESTVEEAMALLKTTKTPADDYIVLQAAASYIKGDIPADTLLGIIEECKRRVVNNNE